MKQTKQKTNAKGGVAAWPDVQKSGATLGNLTPADRHGSVQVRPFLWTHEFFFFCFHFISFHTYTPLHIHTHLLHSHNYHLLNQNYTYLPVRMPNKITHFYAIRYRFVLNRICISLRQSFNTILIYLLRCAIVITIVFFLLILSYFSFLALCPFHNRI